MMSSVKDLYRKYGKLVPVPRRAYTEYAFDSGRVVYSPDELNGERRVRIDVYNERETLLFQNMPLATSVRITPQDAAKRLRRVLMNHRKELMEST